MRSLAVFHPASQNSDKTAAVLVRDNFARLIEDNREILKTSEYVGVEKDYTKFLDLVMSYLGTKYQLQLPEGMFVIGRTSQLYKSYTLLLDPGVKFMGQLFNKWVEVIDPGTLITIDKNQPVECTYEEAVENVADWMSNLANQDIGLYCQVYNYISH